MSALVEIPEEQRVYVDEAGVEDTLSYAYGWSEKGSRCPGERLGHRTGRISIVAAWCQAEVLSPLMFEGYCDHLLIEAWVEQHLIKELRPGQVVMRPGQVVILDNASFHRKNRLREILATVGCTLLPLPPYSPDLNKIEPLWNTRKSRIVHKTQPQPTFEQKVAHAICSL